MADKNEGSVEAWHFLPKNRRLQYDDNRLIERGTIVTVEPPLVLCDRGLHASVRAVDALRYASGPVVCRVCCEGEIIHGDNKLVCEKRTVIAMEDATMLLHTFACDVAEKALQKYDDNPDPRSLHAIEVKRAWIAGNATDEELAAAWDAARAAASAAWDAARAAAWAAARATARATARVAAWDAARAAVWDAAWDAARDAQNRALTDMFCELLGIDKLTN